MHFMQFAQFKFAQFELDILRTLPFTDVASS